MKIQSSAKLSSCFIENPVLKTVAIFAYAPLKGPLGLVGVIHTQKYLILLKMRIAFIACSISGNPEIYSFPPESHAR